MPLEVRDTVKEHYRSVLQPYNIVLLLKRSKKNVLWLTELSKGGVRTSRLGHSGGEDVEHSFKNIVSLSILQILSHKGKQISYVTKGNWQISSLVVLLSFIDRDRTYQFDTLTLPVTKQLWEAFHNTVAKSKVQKSVRG